VTDQIDQFEFIRLEQPPQLVQAKLAAHVRPGVSGITLHDLGTWAAPFTCDSLAQAANLGAAYDLYDGYRLLVGQPAVTILWAQLPIVLKNHRFFVLDVQPLRIARIVFGTGPQGSYFAECECRWTLQPIFFG
jgi:hypothetical protein